MREILFRGKQYGKNKWIYGDLLQVKHFEENRNTCSIMFQTAVAENFPVIPETVGQFTGLTDKNGTKIFEGDIIQFLNYDNEIEHKGIVYWDSGAFWIDCAETEGDEGICLLNAAPTKLYAIVIGNIHDNLELLEGE